MNKFEKKIQAQIDAAKGKLARAKSNMKFARMSPSQKRVEICKDVISMLALPSNQGPTIERGVYFNVNDEAINGSSDLQTIACDSPDSCTVCGIGAMFLAHVRKMDGITIEESNELDDRWELVGEMIGYFPEEQLLQIECAFEGGEVNDSKVLSSFGKEWEKSISDPKDRLRAICKNIITNEGTFKIRQIPK